MDPKQKAVAITDVAAQELSFIFAKFKGENWSPVNGDARVLTTKGQPAKPRKGLLETIKGYFRPDDQAVEFATWPVGEEVPDVFDGDGDGAQDCSAYALAITSAAYDINQAMYLSEPARSQAIFAVVNTFRTEAQAMFGPSEKAGKRHSDSDLKLLQSIKTSLEALLPTETAEGGETTEGEKGEPEKPAAAATGGTQTPEPNQPEEKGSTLTPPAANDGGAAPSADVTALIAKAVADASAAFDAKLNTVKADAETRISAVEKSANERVQKAEAEVAATKTQLEAANASLKALVGEAATPSSGGFVATVNEDGSKNDPAKEVVKAEAQQALKGASTIAQVIQLQNLANS